MPVSTIFCAPARFRWTYSAAGARTVTACRTCSGSRRRVRGSNSANVRNDRLLWAGPVESYRNYVGNNEPLLWLYDAMGRETSVMAISPAVVALMDSGNLSGYAFGPSNELLVDRAFRRVKLDGHRARRAGRNRQDGRC